MNNKYEPKGIYRLKNSTLYNGESIERLVFRDYSYVVGLKNAIDRDIINENNWNDCYVVWKHAKHVLDFGKNLKTNITCKYCGDNKVRNFCIKYNEDLGYAIDYEDICCERFDCKMDLYCNSGKSSLYPISFATTLEFDDTLTCNGTTTHKDQIISIILNLFGYVGDYNEEPFLERLFYRK